MRYESKSKAEHAKIERIEILSAENDVIDAEILLSDARGRLNKAEAEVDTCRERCKTLRTLITSLVECAQRWWDLSTRIFVAVQNNSESIKDLARKNAASVALERAVAREQEARSQANTLKKIMVDLWAKCHAWRSIQIRANQAIPPAIEIERLEADRRIIGEKMCISDVSLRIATATTSEQQRALSAAKEKSIADSQQVERLTTIAEEIQIDGFSGYLARATPADKLIISSLHDQAQAEGKARAGRPPPQIDDPRRVAKIEKANRERERRSRQKSDIPPVESKSEIINNSTIFESPENLFHVPDMAKFCPKRRFHEERLARLNPNDRIVFAKFLAWSRQRGWAAAIADAHSRSNNFQRRYTNPHAAIPLGSGARLIAVRGGSPGFEQLLAARMQADPQALEMWLSEPVAGRVTIMGNRSRLKHGALHLINSWSPDLRYSALRGDLDEALARETDLLLARLGLTGHRAATVLHLDSKSGHPHTHIVVSRVSDDGTLWSLQGRERAVALWLHGRSNTVACFGPDALHDDIDALAGPSDAAKAGEALLFYGKLAADRHHIDGRCERVAIQGKEAASRMWQVGTTGQDLAGGIWLFGLGADPTAKESWESMMNEVRASGDKIQEMEIKNQKPTQRGYWLPIQDLMKDSQKKKSQNGFGRYLIRPTKKVSVVSN